MAQTSPPGMTFTSRDGSKKIRSPSKPCPVMLSALRARGVDDPANFELRSVEVESAKVLDAAVEMLAANEEALAPGYRKFFAAQSPSHQGKPAFRPSFLVPPPAPRLPPRKAVCSNCGKLEADQRRFQKCDGCKSAVYCGSACQTAHWPVHKKVRPPSLLPSLPCMSLQTFRCLLTQVCRKDAEKLRGKDTQGRESLVTPMLSYRSYLQQVTGRDMSGANESGFSLNGAPDRREVRANDTFRNIHGDDEFTVKVQIPGDGSFGSCMVYDEQRSFEVCLTRDVPGAEKIHWIIRSGGPMGLKGYFAARRDGAHLRIFLDRLLDPPSW